MSTDRTTEILNYLSAMSRDIGDFRAKMSTDFGTLRTDFGTLRTDFGTLSTEVGELRKEVGELRKEVRVLTNRFDRLEARVINTHADVDDLERRVAALEGKQD